MTDIVERLWKLTAIDNCRASVEAANEIERLRAENEQLRAVIQRVYQSSNQPRIIEMARAALDGQPTQPQEEA